MRPARQSRRHALTLACLNSLAECGEGEALGGPWDHLMTPGPEHGPGNDVLVDMATVAYWYQTEPHRPFQNLPPPDQRRILDDGTTVGWFPIAGDDTGYVRMNPRFQPTKQGPLTYVGEEAPVGSGPLGEPPPYRPRVPRRRWSAVEGAGFRYL
jgi:hypothetical protein